MFVDDCFPLALQTGVCYNGVGGVEMLSKDLERRKQNKHNYYQLHKEEIQERTRIWVKNNQEKCRGYARKANTIYMRKWRKAHPEQEARYRLARKKLKEEVLTHYGKGRLACVMCGENRTNCLSIDHIEGGGNKERHNRLRASHAFYRWLKNNGYPKGYQTLCMNCQFIKRFELGEHSGYKHE